MFNEIIIKSNMFVFLGGTTAGAEKNNWRDQLIPKLKIKYFNPVVKDWTPAHKKLELQMRDNAAFVLYVISPTMTGVYSIAEVIDDSNKRPESTIFCFLPADGDKKFDESQTRSMKAVGEMVIRNGAKWVDTLDDVATLLNTGRYIPSKFAKLGKE